MEFLTAIYSRLSDLISPESISRYIDFFGPFIYLFLFMAALLESFVFTGLVIPGTIVVVSIGFIASQGSLDLVYLFILTSSGAILGDVLNFYLGRTQGEKLIVSLTKFFKLKVDYLKMGEDFFKKHGDKSVFIGRFVAVIRPFIPFVAGIFKMRWSVFMLWNILSGLIWAGLYLSLGYFFGAALKSIVEWSGRVGVILLAILILIIATYIVRKKFAGKRSSPVGEHKH